MVILLSPAKRLDFKGKVPDLKLTKPAFNDKAAELAGIMKKKSPGELMDLQGISRDLAELNYGRFQKWKPSGENEGSHPALFAFRGDAYQGLSAEGLSAGDLEYAQGHLRILSGLYGMLRPLDLIMPYRLEMGTSLQGKGFTDLYDYWKDTLTEGLAALLKEEGSGILVNLASDEYFNAIDTKKLDAKVIKPVFKEFRNGKYMFLSYYGKRARGMMTSYLIRNRVESLEVIKGFREEKYLFDENLSDAGVFVFTR